MSSYPPPYQYGRKYSSRDMSAERKSSRPAFSGYPEEEQLHFYRWTSPPGVIKILAIIIIVLTVAIFACVASTLAWDYDMQMAGLGGLGTGIATGSFGSSYNNFGSGGYGGYGGYGMGSGYGYGGIGGNYTSPMTGKGFIIAIAAFVFVACLIIFILVVSRQKVSRSRGFYLAVIIISSILCIFMLISTAVYLVAINPTAQASGSAYYSQVAGLCAQYQTPQSGGIFLNQYMYQYCVVQPQEAVAAVLGFLVTIGLIIIAIFAAKTRQKIWSHGRNILWHDVKVINRGATTIGEMVHTVSGEPEAMLHASPDKIMGSRDFLDGYSDDYAKPPDSLPELRQNQPLWSPGPYNTEWGVGSDVGELKLPPPGYPHRTVFVDDTDYNTEAESGDELGKNDFNSEFPPIYNDQMRQDYRREFDRDHKDYKLLQVELDDINKGLSEVDSELYNLQKGSTEYLDAVDEYNHLTNLKKSADYQMKKKRCKYLKAKLSHIKKMVSDYDRRV